jgi:hypothetical protein
MALILHFCERASSDRSNVTFKIEAYRDEHGTTIRLIGRLRAEHLSDLEKQIPESEPRIVLDLEGLDLIDVEAVRFLGMCETQGVTLLKLFAIYTALDRQRTRLNE